MALRVTHRTLFSSNLANLQQNLSRIQGTQEKLSSGKVLSTPSDDPGGAGAALRQRAEIDRSTQLVRNANDGLGWLETADSALGQVGDLLARARELLVAANNTGTLSQNGAEAMALEIDALREQMINVGNTRYLGRPIFGGTIDAEDAFDAAGNFTGNTQAVERAVRPGVSVQVNVTAAEVFGGTGQDTIDFLATVSDHLRNDWTQLSGDLGAIDGHLENAWGSRSKVGSRYAQVEAMRNRTEDDLLLLKERLSEIEDIDLPATIVDLQLQETAYQAALSATSRSIQPSLMDFLR